MLEKQLKSEIHRRLLWQFVHKSNTAAPPVAILALVLAWSKLGVTEYSGLITFLLVVCTANAVVRYFIGHAGLKKSIQEASVFKFVFYSIVLNAFLWSVSFWLMAIQIPTGSTKFLMIFIISISLALSAVLTLVYIPYLSIGFQLGSLFGVFFALIQTYMVTENSENIHAALAIFLFEIFCLRYTYSHYRELFYKYKYEVDLEKSLEQVKESNQRVADEMARSQFASRMAALGEMAGGVAHEINNPLAIINGLVEQSVRALEHHSDRKEFVLEKLNRVMAAVDRIRRIVKSMRYVSHQTGESEEFMIAQTEDLVEDVMNISFEKFKNSGIELLVENIPQVSVKTKPVLVSQVLINLLNNAFDELNQPYQLGTKRFVKIRFNQNAKKLVVSVENSGPLITSHVQSKLFQPFFTTKEIGKGTGLGLSICKGIVESMGEEIWFERQLPRTTFSFTLALEGQL